MKRHISFLLVGWLWAVTAQAADLSADDAWVRWVPPVSNNSAAYFTLHNEGSQGRTLLKAHSAIAAAVEIHQVIESQGGMSMRPVSSVSIEANDCVFFEPGGYHVMLIGLKKPLQENAMVDIELEFEGGERLTVPFKVKK